MSDYETAGGPAGRPSRNYPASWGVPRGTTYSAERRNWVANNIRSNPLHALDRLAGVERRAIRAELEEIDAKLRALGVDPGPAVDI